MQYLKSEKGFSLVELLIVITIMAIIFGATVPFYRRYVAQTELRNVSQDLYLKLVSAQNKAINGVVPKGASGSNQRYYWIVHVHQVQDTWEYETKACALQPLPPLVSQFVYDNQFSFNFCDSQDYEYHTFPERFSITHNYSASNLEANIYFEPITGHVKVYNIDGDRLDDISDLTKSAIDIKITSIDYPDLTVTFHVTRQGMVSQETTN